VRRDSFRGHFAAQSRNTEESGGTCELFVYLMKDLVSGEFYGTMDVRHIMFHLDEQAAAAFSATHKINPSFGSHARNKTAARSLTGAGVGSSQRTRRRSVRTWHRQSRAPD
jgi:hypothetical protein